MICTHMFCFLGFFLGDALSVGVAIEGGRWTEGDTNELMPLFFTGAEDKTEHSFGSRLILLGEAGCGCKALGCSAFVAMVMMLATDVVAATGCSTA